MSQTTHRNRLAYDDPATVHEMHDDCREVTSRLHLPASRGTSVILPHSPTRWAVPDRAAHMADAIHLHLS